MASVTCTICGSALTVAPDSRFLCPNCGVFYTKEEVQHMLSAQTEDPLWDWQQIGDGAALCAYKGEGPEANVPSTFHTLPVIRLEPGAFYSKKKLRYVSLPDTIHTIGRLAFCKCLQLEQLNLPQCLRTIERDAFSRCLKLKKLDMPQTVETILDSAFSGCGTLRELRLPDGIRVLHLLTFYDCKNLQTLTLPSRLEVIEDSALCNCSSLTQLSLPETLTSIGTMAFWGCTSLQQLRIPASVEAIGQMAFGAPNGPHPLLLVDRDSSAAHWAAENNCPYQLVN